jgi:hypothetical protein
MDDHGEYMEVEVLQKLEKTEGDTSSSILEDCVFSTLQTRLLADGHHVDDLRKEDIRLVLPQIGCSNQINQQELLSRWTRLMKRPISISDQELQSLIYLKECTENTQDHCGTHFYVKTLKLSSSEFREIIKECISSDIYKNKFTYWQEIASGIDKGDMAYLRYAGMTHSRSVWNRHMFHLEAGPFAIIANLLRERFPAVIEEVKLYELPKGHIPERTSEDPLVAQRLRDLRERALIALFGRKYLLNNQSGGQNNDFTPSKADKHAA